MVVIRGEPVSLASKQLIATGLSVRPASRLFNAELDIADASDSPQPYLTEALPQLNTPTWRVLPDGRMETVYRLRPNLTWHDGVPLSAADFVFGWRVYSTPEYGQSRTVPILQMEEVAAPDAQTVLIRWKGPYPEANFLRDTFQALPRHILEAVHQQGDSEVFANHPYWSTAYLGAGPYRLERWEPGAFIEGVAFDDHVLGRPKIERASVRFMPDENTVLATVLSDQVHFTAGQTLRYEHVQVLKQEWVPSGRGTVIAIPIQLRFIHVQLRPELASPTALMDLRARRALVHALDRSAIDQGLYDGLGFTTETFLPRVLSYWAEIDRAIQKYPHDPRRAEQLLNELGFLRGGDGLLIGSDGGRFSFELLQTVGVPFQREEAVITEGWGRIGIETTQTILPVAQLRNGELRNSFRGLHATAGAPSSHRSLGMLTTGAIGGPANAWTGQNRGGWSNPGYDRLWDSLNSTLDPGERIQHMIQMEQLIAEHIPLIMLVHHPWVVTHAASLKGIDAKAHSDLPVWNIHEWELR